MENTTRTIHVSGGDYSAYRFIEYVSDHKLTFDEALKITGEEIEEYIEEAYAVEIEYKEFEKVPELFIDFIRKNFINEEEAHGNFYMEDSPIFKQV